MSRINFGHQLKLALKKAGRSQKWLALTLGMPHQNVSRWIYADDAKLSTICRICDALDMSVAEFCALGQFINYSGQGQPVGDGAFVDLQFRSGSSNDYLRAGDMYWGNDDCPSDIIAYRVCALEVNNEA